MNKLSHIISNHIFIFATSIAMLVHSTWTFGTLFSGKQPELNGLNTLVPYLMWVTPALLVALAIDVGQIQTSVKLAKAQKLQQQLSLGFTFLVLALAGYYLQWFHLAHHIPALEFGSGLSPEMQDNLKSVKDLAIFIVPALLPLSTILYTVSSVTDKEEIEQPQQKIESTEFVGVTFPAIEPRIWSDDTQHIHVLTGDEDTEPYATMPALIEDEPKSVTRPVKVKDSEIRRCAHDGCNKMLNNPRANQKYCNVNCRNNAYKARQ